MTAPALPGAAPDPAPGRNDPARLPEDVERAMQEALAASHDFGATDSTDPALRDAAQRDIAAEAALRAAIAAHVAPPGEPVAWQIVARDGTPAIAYASLDSAMEHIGPGETMRPLFTRPAPPVSASFEETLTGLDVEPTHHPDRMVTTYTILGLDDVRAAHAEAVRVAVEAEREACAALFDPMTTDVEIRRKLGREGMKEAAAAIRARGVAKPRTDSEASEQGAKS